MNSRPTDDFDSLDSSWRRRAEILEDFEDCWRAQHDADLAAFAARVPYGASRERLVRELVKIDLEYRWRRGEQVRVETYAERFLELARRDSSSMDLIAEEIRVRILVGRPPTRDELIGRFPELDAELSELLAAAMSRAGPAEAPEADSTARTLLGTPVRATQTDGSARTAAASSPTSPLPRRLGRYELLEQVGRGGFSTVYRANDADLRRVVAVKLLRRDQFETSVARDRLLREAHAAARLRHPAIVPIHEVCEAEGESFLVFEFVPGPTLTGILRDRPVEPRQAAEWAARLAEALDYAHENGVIHRDVKPANVMMDERGHPMLTDFGLALQTDAAITLTQHGDIVGTPAYMSPEQAQGESHSVDARTDVYSLGVLLFELLCGRVPFPGGGPSVLHQVIHDEAPPPSSFRPGVPLDLETITLKCLAKARERRYATAGELAADLRRWLADEPISARPPGIWERGARWVRRRPTLTALAAATTLGVISLISASLWHNAKLSLALTDVENQRVLAESRRTEAQREREQAEEHLYHSLLGQSRALRLARGAGYRDQAWALLKQAADLPTPVRNLDMLRLEAIACLGDFAGLEPEVHDFSEDVLSLAVRPDGKQLAVGLRSGALAVRELDSRDIMRLSGHRATVRVVVYSRDGTTLVSGDATGMMKVWESSAAGAWNCRHTIPLSSAGVAAIALTADGTQAAVLTVSGTSVELWNLVDGTRMHEFPFPAGQAEKVYGHGLAMHPAGSLLAAGYRQDEAHGVFVWDVATREVVQRLSPRLDEVYDVTFSPDGQVLACGCGIGVALYDTSSFALRGISRGDWMGRFAFSPDSRLMAFPHPPLGLVRLQGTGTNQEVATLKHPGTPRLAAFDAQGATLVTAGASTIRIWSLAGTREKQVLSGHLSGVASLTFSPDGDLLVSVSADRKLRVRDTRSGATLRTLDLAGPAQALAFSPNGRYLATGDWVGNLEIWNTSSWRHEPVPDHDLGRFVWTAAFSDDGERFGAGGERGVALWRVEDDSPNGSAAEFPALQPLARPTRAFTRSMAFGPARDLVAWVDHAEGRPMLRVWEPSGRRLLDLPPIELAGSIHSLTFTPDGQGLFGVAARRHLTKWNLETRQEEFSLAGGFSTSDDAPPQGGVLALSRDGRRLATQAGRTVAVWDVSTRKMLAALPEPRAIPWCLAWHPDGERIAVGWSDGGVAIWHLPRVQAQLAEIGLDW